MGSGGFPKLINLCLSVCFKSKMEDAWDDLQSTEDPVDPCVQLALESGLSSIKSDPQEVSAAKADVAMHYFVRPGMPGGEQTEMLELDSYEQDLLKALSESGDFEDFALTPVFTSEAALDLYIANIDYIISNAEQPVPPSAGSKAARLAPFMVFNEEDLSPRGRQEYEAHIASHAEFCKDIKAKLEEFVLERSVSKRLALTPHIILKMDVWGRMVLGPVPTCTPNYSNLLGCRMFGYFHAACYMPYRFSAPVDPRPVLRGFFGDDLDDDRACMMTVRKLTHKLDASLETYVRRAMGFYGAYASELPYYLGW